MPVRRLLLPQSIRQTAALRICLRRGMQRNAAFSTYKNQTATSPADRASIFHTRGSDSARNRCGEAWQDLSAYPSKDRLHTAADSQTVPEPEVLRAPASDLPS